MKRNYGFHKKISPKSGKKLCSPCEPSCSTSIQPSDATRNENASAIILATSRRPHQVIDLEQEIQKQTTQSIPPLIENLSTVTTDSFRSRLTAKLRTALDGFVSELQSISQSKQPDAASFLSEANAVADNYLGNSIFHNNDNLSAKLALQNFIHSAKSQISGLLSKGQKLSDENCLPTTKPFIVDPLQIQISLKLQDLLCNALDNRKFESNATNSSEPISETEWQDLSHLLQGFLSSAKEKLSLSLSADSGRQSTATFKSSTCTADSVSEKNRPSIHSKSLYNKTSNNQHIGEHNKKEGGLRKLRSNTCLADSRSGKSNDPPKKSFQGKSSDKQSNTIQVYNKKPIKKISNTRAESTNGQNSKNILFSHSKSCQKKISTKQLVQKRSERIGVLCKKLIQEGSSSNAVKSISCRINKNQISQPLLQNKSCQTTELHIFKPIPEQDSNQRKVILRSEKNLQPQGTNFSSATMEIFDDSDSSSIDGPDRLTYTNGGILLLSECERTPDFLDLDLEVHDSDVDDPESDNQESDSGEDVVVLGEKKPTYQEITLDEDDDGEVYEQVVEMEKPAKLPKDLEDMLYDCPKCDKKFRVESLLKFHIRMHSVVESHGRMAAPSSFEAAAPEDAPGGDCINRRDRTTQKSKSSKRHPRKEKENNKLNSKSSHKHRIHKEKRSAQVKRKSKMST